MRAPPPLILPLLLLFSYSVVSVPSSRMIGYSKPRVVESRPDVPGTKTILAPFNIFRFFNDKRNDVNDTDRKMQIHTFWSKRSGSSPGVETKLLTPTGNSNNNILDNDYNPEPLHSKQHNTRRFQVHRFNKVRQAD